MTQSIVWSSSPTLTFVLPSWKYFHKPHLRELVDGSFQKNWMTWDLNWFDFLGEITLLGLRFLKIVKTWIWLGLDCPCGLTWIVTRPSWLGLNTLTDITHGSLEGYGYNNTGWIINHLPIHWNVIMISPIVFPHENIYRYKILCYIITVVYICFPILHCVVGFHCQFKDSPLLSVENGMSIISVWSIVTKVSIW